MQAATQPCTSLVTSAVGACSLPALICQHDSGFLMLQQVLVLTDPDLYQPLLRSGPQKLPKYTAPYRMFEVFTKPHRSNILSSPENPTWKAVRRAAVAALTMNNLRQVPPPQRRHRHRPACTQPCIYLCLSSHSTPPASGTWSAELAAPCAVETFSSLMMLAMSPTGLQAPSAGTVSADMPSLKQ